MHKYTVRALCTLIFAMLLLSSCTNVSQSGTPSSDPTSNASTTLGSPVVESAATDTPQPDGTATVTGTPTVSATATPSGKPLATPTPRPGATPTPVPPITPTPAPGKTYRQIGTMPLPNMTAIQTSWSFDISWVDQANHLYYLADRVDKGVDVFDLQSRKYITTIGGFLGVSGGNKGPNGVVTDNLGQLWATDGDSTVKVISLSTRQIIATVSTGGQARADEIAYDAQDKLIIVGNGDDSPAFLTLISASDHTVVKKITLNSAMGIEQPAWDPATDLFYVSVPESSANPGGEVDVISPQQQKVVKVVSLSNCNPSGFAIGPVHSAILGCDGSPVIIDLTSWQVLATITQASGCDEVWYNSGSGQYYLAASSTVGGSVLAIVDAKTLKWLQNVPTKTNSHSVASDASANIVLVPEVGMGIVIYAAQ